MEDRGGGKASAGERAERRGAGGLWDREPDARPSCFPRCRRERPCPAILLPEVQAGAALGVRSSVAGRKGQAATGQVCLGVEAEGFRCLAPTSLSRAPFPDDPS